MATIFRTVSGGGPGITVSLAASDNFVLADGVQIFSDNDTVIEGTSSNELFLSANSAVIGFGNSSIKPAILLGSTGASSQLFVSETASVWAPSNAVESKGNSSEIVNYGQINGGQLGIDMEGSSNTVVNTGDIVGTNFLGVRVWEFGEIDNSGVIRGGGFGAVTRTGAGRILNSGDITGDTAVYMEGDGNNTVTSFTNSGTALGQNYGFFTPNGASTVTNTGTIIGQNIGAIVHQFISEDVNHVLKNAGTISSPFLAYSGAAGVDKIDNTGTMQGDIVTADGSDVIRTSGIIQGDIDLGDDADTYQVTGTGQTSGQVDGGLGNDLLQGGLHEDNLAGGDGDDTVSGGGGNDSLSGDGGADRMRGQDGHDSITGGALVDSLWGGTGDDTVRGDGGSDMLFGEAGDDLVDGGNGRDKVYGGAGDDTVIGGGSDDLLSGGSGDDSLRGGSNNDTLKGGSGDDTLEGGTGQDQVQGGSGDDLLLGEEDADILRGGRGADTLNGGAGADTLSGGQDADVFEFIAASDTGVGANDQITDFTQGLDQMDLSGIGALDFVGTNAFAGGGQGSVRYVRINADNRTEVRIDVDGDGLIDAQIQLDGAMTLIGTDFIL